MSLTVPVKRSPGVGPAYMEAEKAVMAAVCERFGLSREEPPEVRLADSRVLMAEARDLMAKPPMVWREGDLAPMERTVVGMMPVEAEAFFRARFREIVDSKGR